MEDEGLSLRGEVDFFIERQGSQNDLAVGIPQFKHESLGDIVGFIF